MRVAILGLGLIGVSLALALREARPEWTLIGWDQDPAALALARSRGAIALAAAELADAAQADVVVLATPVLAMRGLLGAIAPHLAPGSLVTDVASTKASVVAWAAELLPAGVTFVGGHPMAGGSRAGGAHARADLFAGAVYCVTPEAGTPAAAVERLEALAAAIGATPLRLEPARHDAFVAAVSHMPFALSAALVRAVAADPDWPAMGRLAATGFRDVSRLASGDVAMHRDICLTNAPAIADWLRKLAAQLGELADGLEDAEAVEAFFREAREAREDWLETQPRFRSERA